MSCVKTKLKELYNRIFRNKKMINWCNLKVKNNRINLNYCNYPDENIGDMLSPIIYNYMTDMYSLDRNKKVAKTIHLFIVGSIISFGYQDAVVWGSGLLNDAETREIGKGKKWGRKLDIRAVRGPLTRRILENSGYDCPEIYGDPAVLMPMIYSPERREKKYKVSLIIHLDNMTEDKNLQRLILPEGGINIISVLTNDYKYVIDEIVASEKIISSSLHGIILAESYGVPAVMILNDISYQIMKFYDWYLATGRSNFQIASSIEQAVEMKPTELPVLDGIRKRLIENFPIDIWSD